jgi:SP family myo-inositol transporter-like MFS transporter 13
MHFLPESPRIMAARGERERAKAILRKVYGSATDEVIDLKLRVIDVTIREMSKLNTQYTFRERVKVLWTHKPYRRAIIAVSGMQAFGQLTGYNSLLYYSGTLFGLLGFSNAAIAGLIPSGGNALCVVSEPTDSVLDLQLELRAR